MELHYTVRSVRPFARRPPIDMKRVTGKKAVFRTYVLLAIVVLGLGQARAGGPLYVAGSGFNTGLAGTPVTWAGGQITYFTDQGDLSSLLASAAADQFVADAFSRWSLVSTARRLKIRD